MINREWKDIKVSKDTRTIKPGDYYVPVKGERFDGHDFINEAKALGAVGVIEEKELYTLTQRKLSDYKPIVVGVTGSTGKTTAKDVISTVLLEGIEVCSSQGNLNTLLGLSLGIINNLEKKHRVFVAEIGMDRLNEIKEICSVIKPNISVITSINETHLEKLKTIENIIKTKGQILEALDKKGFAVLNRDDPNAMRLATTGLGRKIYFSAKTRCDVWAESIKTDMSGTSFTLNISSKGLPSGRIKVTTPLLGMHSVYPTLCAVSVAGILGLNLRTISSGLLKLRYPKGRLNILRGESNSTLIDDTYNSSPASCLAAIDILKIFKGKRKIVILGDMLELGDFEKEAHKLVGKLIAESSVDLFIAVGKRMGDAADAYNIAVLSANGKPNVIRYDSTKEALSDILSKVALRSSDVALIKGSQGMRMEKIVALLLSDKGLAEKVLVRQDVTWK